MGDDRRDELAATPRAQDCEVTEVYLAVYHNITNPRLDTEGHQCGRFIGFGFDCCSLVWAYGIQRQDEVVNKPTLIVAEELWQQDNEGQRPYGVRSLSVGDVLLIVDGDDRRAFKCLAFGWMELNRAWNLPVAGMHPKP